MENECLICFEQKTRFAVMCRNGNHRVCEQCFGEIVDVQICAVCRQLNPIYERFVQQQQDQIQEQEQEQEQEEEEVPYLQLGISDEQIHIKILRFPFTRSMKQEIDSVLETFIQNPRRSERIAQRNRYKMQKQEVSVKVKKEKKKRTIDPTKMTYIKAFQIWRERQEPKYVGLSPKKGTQPYDEIMQILRQGK